MNTGISQEIENKENVTAANKPRNSLIIQRTFGTDLTKIVQSLPSISSDPFHLSYYEDEIYKNLHSTEQQYIARFGYMKNQVDISEKMRSILVDWLVEVHYKFKLTNETLFLSVNILDRYLEKIPVCKNRLQLVGVTSMLIASKYEDIYPPEIQDFVYITDKAYIKEEILSMETSILKQLEYNLTVPSSYRFLERLIRVDNSSEQHIALARYLLELTLVDYKMLRYCNSLIAAACIYLMHKIVCIKPEWSEGLAACAPYQEHDLKPCAKEICMLFQKTPKSSLQGVRNKFSTSQYYNVANTPLI